jgi:hypothetical protein
MLRCVALVRTLVSEERIASIIRVTRIGELGTALVLTSNDARCEEISAASYYLRSYRAYSCHPDDAGDTFLRNVGSYKSHTS